MKIIKTPLYNVFPRNHVGRKLTETVPFNMENGPWIAGGAMRKYWVGQEMGKSDWDIYFKNERQFQKVLDILAPMSFNERKNLKIETKNAVTVFFRDGEEYHDVQLIKKYFDSSEDVINSFDFTVCQFITDGDIIKYGEHTLSDNKNKLIRLNRKERLTQKGFASRFHKYVLYGYRPSDELWEQIEQNNDAIQWEDDTYGY